MTKEVTMHNYVGRSSVKAMPMSHHTFEALMDRNVDTDLPDTDGYLVEQTDSGIPNHCDYEGYISWLNADDFKARYNLSDVKCQDRVAAVELGHMWQNLGAVLGDVTAISKLTELEVGHLTVKLNLLRQLIITFAASSNGLSKTLYKGYGVPSIIEDISWEHARTYADFGYRILRKGWNGAGLYVLSNPTHTSMEYKDIEHDIIRSLALANGGYVEMSENYLIKNKDSVLSPWIPSTNDTYADDWVVIANAGDFNPDDYVNVADEHTPRTFRKKPVSIDAIQWDGTEESTAAVLSFIGNRVDSTSDSFKVYAESCAMTGMPIDTLEGVMRAQPGDYIIRGVNGEFYPCKPDIFGKTYDVV